MEQTQVLTFLNNKDRDLLLQFCGYSTTEPLHSFGPVVRPHYIIHFILNRKGIFQIHEKTYHLETGQGFLIEPDELTYLATFFKTFKRWKSMSPSKYRKQKRASGTVLRN